MLFMSGTRDYNLKPSTNPNLLRLLLCYFVDQIAFLDELLSF